jgi:CHAD domain-containing protein
MSVDDDASVRPFADRSPFGDVGFCLAPGETLAAAIKAVSIEEIGGAIALLGETACERSHVVHLVRRRLKRIRSLLVALDEVPGANRPARVRQLRDAARLLAPGRDADVLAASAARIAADGGEVAGVATRLAERLAGAADAAHAAAVPFETVIARLRASEADLRSLPDDFPAGPLLAAGLVAAYRGGRRDWRDCGDGGSDEALHDWRKQVKDRRHLSAMVPFETPVTSRAVRRDLDRLAEILGDEHDFALLAARLAAEPDLVERRGDREALGETIARRRRRLKKEALALGEELYGDRVRDFAAAVAGLDEI